MDDSSLLYNWARTCEACRCARAYTHVDNDVLNADRDVDLSGAKTADAVSSRHRLLPFDNRERASHSLSEFRMWRDTRRRKKLRDHEGKETISAKSCLN